MATQESAFRRYITEIEDSDEGARPVAEIPQVAPLDGPAGLLKYMRDNTIGDQEAIPTPFGDRRIVYTDHTATGRSLRFIENYIFQEVLPVYGNTHSSHSATSLQTSCFRHEARTMIKKYVNGSEVNDVLIFTGNGSTAAINHFVNLLNLRNVGEDATDRPVVFIGPHEHHSNILPWREAGAQVVVIGEDEHGVLDAAELERNLTEFKERTTKIGSFSAASNVTGILADTVAITILLHRFDALACWDYASAGPHVKINMNPSIGTAGHAAYADAIFLSPHKFPGGPSTPGILVAKKVLFTPRVLTGSGRALGPAGKRLRHADEQRDGQFQSTTPGGGTVFYVTDTAHRYLENIEEREEGGTPNIVGSIRAAMAFQLKEAVTPEVIQTIESGFIEKAWTALLPHPSVVLLGPRHAPHGRLPILSFMIACGDRFLHYNFVVALLNDLFGIQARGGCACAGPYGQRLLGMDDALAKSYEGVLLQGQEILRPGFVRVGFTVCMEPEVVDYVVDAIKFIADNGWRFMPQYRFFVDSGEWRHRQHTKSVPRRWLQNISYAQGICTFPRMVRECDTRASHLQTYLAEAAAQATKAGAAKSDATPMATGTGQFKEAFEALRWFVLPGDVVNGVPSLAPSPAQCLDPRRYRLHCCAPGTSNGHTNRAEANGKTGAESTESVAEEEDGLFGVSVDEGEEPKTVRPRVMHAPAELFPKPSLKLMQLSGKAMADFEMLKDGDRVLVGLSGGKDSMTLLHLLHQRRRTLPIKFELGAVTIDPQTEAFDPEPLKAYMASLGIKYFYESANLIDQAGDRSVRSICSWCARMKRGMLYTALRREGYNVLALGQHLDDFAESMVMSMFYNGQARTMKAHYVIDAGDIRVIRPLVYVREYMTRTFAAENQLPVISENCPGCFEAPKERDRVKMLLAEQETLFPNLFSSLLRAMTPFMKQEANEKVTEEDEESSCAPRKRAAKVPLEESLARSGQNTA